MDKNVLHQPEPLENFKTFVDVHARTEVREGEREKNNNAYTYTRARTHCICACIHVCGSLRARYLSKQLH